MFKKSLFLFAILMAFCSASSATSTVIKCVHKDNVSGAREIYQIINGNGLCGEYLHPASGNKPAQKHDPTSSVAEVQPKDCPQCRDCQTIAEPVEVD